MLTYLFTYLTLCTVASDWVPICVHSSTCLGNLVGSPQQVVVLLGFPPLLFDPPKTPSTRGEGGKKRGKRERAFFSPFSCAPFVCSRTRSYVADLEARRTLCNWMTMTDGWMDAWWGSSHRRPTPPVPVHPPLLLLLLLLLPSMENCRGLIRSRYNPDQSTNVCSHQRRKVKKKPTQEGG